MPKILIVTGPSSAGKTTSVKCFLKNVKGTWAYVGQDDVHGLIKVGYKSANGLRQTWDNETLQQWQSSIKISCDLIKSLNHENINCVVDCSATANELKEWTENLNGLAYHLVVIIPDLETALIRNNQKTGNARLEKGKIRECYQQFCDQDFPEPAKFIFTSGNDLDSVVEGLLVAVQ